MFGVLALAIGSGMGAGTAWGQGDSLSASQPKWEVLDGIVAVVGDEIVLESDVEAAVFARLAERAQQGKSGTLSADERCALLEETLFTKLLVHQARIDSVEVTESEVLAEIDRRLAYYIRMLGTVEAFEREYGQTVSEWKAEFSEPIRDQLLAQRMQGEINKQVRATPAEVQARHASTPVDSLPLIPEALSYSEVVLQPAITDLQKLAVRDQLDSIRTLVETGKLSMTLAASRFSEDPGSKYKGGCYTDVGRGQFVPEFEAAAFDTPVGDLSPVFESDFGYHFLRVTERRGELYSACHVLMSPRIDAEELERMAVQMDSIGKALASGSLGFDDVVDRFSTREETRNQRGTVVNPSDGGTRWGVDELEADVYLVLAGLEPGGTSAPVQLQDADGKGYVAVFRLDGRYPAHRANPKDDYALFQTLVENELSARQLNRWIDRRLAEVYVRIDAPYTDCTFERPWHTAANQP
jgi:peptidyl-prolyl cis-trans isomerase SurA